MSNKYDRQLRLWGDFGQIKLKESKVALINSEPSGCETLKNLILSGIGYVKIFDNSIATIEDLENNFYISEQDVGKPRAHVIHQLLELNPECNGDSQEIGIEQFLNDFSLLQDFHSIICCNLLPYQEIQLSQFCSLTRKGLFLIKVNGLISSLRVYKPQHEIWDLKPADQIIEDLRIGKPFSSLQNYCDSLDLSTLSDQEHRAVPYNILLIKFLKKWKAGGRSITSFNDKSEFRESIKLEARQFDKEDNFFQAYSNYYKAFKDENQLPENLERLFENLKKVQLLNDGQLKRSFWVLVEALKNFYSLYNRLPLSSKFPDMISSTHSYLHVKSLYTEQSKADYEIFKMFLPKDFPLTESQNFFKNILVLDYQEMRDLLIESQSPLTDHFFENDTPKWFLILKACDEFRVQHQRYPTQSEPDMANLFSILTSFSSIPGYSSFFPISFDFVKEICRYEGKSVHSINALMGGVASQEIVKIISNQFLPLNNTFIYDGVKCEAGVFEF